MSPAQTSQVSLKTTTPARRRARTSGLNLKTRVSKIPSAFPAHPAIRFSSERVISTERTMLSARSIERIHRMPRQLTERPPAVTSYPSITSVFTPCVLVATSTLHTCARVRTCTRNNGSSVSPIVRARARISFFPRIPFLFFFPLSPFHFRNHPPPRSSPPPPPSSPVPCPLLPFPLPTPSPSAISRPSREPPAAARVREVIFKAPRRRRSLDPSSSTSRAARARGGHDISIPPPRYQPQSQIRLLRRHRRSGCCRAGEPSCRFLLPLESFREGDTARCRHGQPYLHRVPRSRSVCHRAFFPFPFFLFLFRFQR